MTTKKRLAFSIVAIFAVGFAGSVLFTRWSQQSKLPEQTKPDANRTADFDSPPTISRIQDTDKTSADPDSQLAPEAIEDELLASFENAEQLQAFLDQATGKPYQVLAYSTKLLTARIRVSDPNSRAAIARQASSIGDNFTVLTPFPVASPTSGSNIAFDNTALDFMRVPYGNQDAGSGITIAILDSGVRSHATLGSKTFDSIDLTETGDSEALASHGTAVASLIFGQDGNGIAPAANLLSIRVIDTDGIGDTFTLAEGIVEAVDAGASIINMSVASYGSNSTLDAAIAYAHANDAVLVASAGNDSLATLPYPAAYDSVIAVSAIDAQGSPTDFSNQSESIAISAPGVGVFAAWEDDAWVSFSGTSAAAPYVSGAIASIASQLPDISPREAADLLLANANDTGLPGPDSQTGAGYLDLQRALDSQTPYSDLALSSIYLSPSVNSDGSQTLYLSAQNRGTTPLASADLQFTLPNGITQTVYLGAIEPGQTASHAIALTQSELDSPDGYAIEANVTASSSDDTHPENDAKRLTLLPDP